MIKPEWIPSAYRDADRKEQPEPARRGNSKLLFLKEKHNAIRIKFNKFK